MRFVIVSTLGALWASGWMAACGGLGAPCDDRGSTRGCGPGQICAKVEGDLHCRDICDRDSDCAPDEKCSGVKDSKDKACKPEDDHDDPGPPFD